VVFQNGLKKRVLHLSGQPVYPVTLSLMEKIGQKLGSPQIMLILLVIGILGIYLEVKTPGATLPGLVGGIALVGFLFASRILPINYLGILLVLLAIILFITEIYVTSFGALTVAGLTALAVGLKVLFQTEKSVGVQIPMTTIFAIIAVVGAFVVILGALLARDLRRRKRTGREGIVGETGIAKTRIAASGKIFVHGEIWDACADGGPIAEGESVVVKGVRGLLLVVVAKIP